jgi:hypothetical protein
LSIISAKTNKYEAQLFYSFSNKMNCWKNELKNLNHRRKRIPRIQASHLHPTAHTKRKKRRPKAVNENKGHKKDMKDIVRL